ncbi:MAG: hypothetical protein KGY74_07635 [Candidatus Cloacimonetes bacterium]|nr:hypothetical protein [Candidatus Cloacimonadota bacterium]
MEQKNAGNQPEKKEQLKIAGKSTTVEYLKDGEVNVHNPEGLEGEELESWQKQAESEISALARSNKKGYDANRKLEKVEKEKQEAEKTWQQIQKEKQELQKLKSELKNREIEEPLDIRSELGVKTYEEVRDILDSDPEKYFAAMNKVTSKSSRSAQKRASSEAQKAVLRNKITSEGYDPAEVESFCEGYLGAPFTQNGYDVYKRMHPNSGKTETDAIADIQKEKITFINRSPDNESESRPKTKAELDQMSVAELKEYYKSLNKG